MNRTLKILGFSWLIIGIIHILAEFNIINIGLVPNYIYAMACFTLAIAFFKIKI